MPPQPVEVTVDAVGKPKGVRVGDAEIKGVVKVARTYVVGQVVPAVEITVLASTFTETQQAPASPSKEGSA
jgi:hypothetical protein